MKLIILNGPPGVGKSTLAQRLHKDLPLSLLIEIDTWRSFISGYREHRKESLNLANKYALAIAELHLLEGHDVIVDKAILDMDDVIDEMRESGERAGAEVYEFILFADKEVVLKRAEQRGYRPGGLLTPERAAERWEMAKTMSERRTFAKLINTSTLSPEEVYAKVHADLFDK